MTGKYINSKRIIGRSAILLVFFMAGINLFGQELTVSSDDLRLEQSADEGFHLFIRKKPDIASVLLTESTRDPSRGADNFAYRAPLWNAVNGDEVRVLNGAPIPRESGIFSLIDSTTETHPELGEAFHIFIPWIVVFGYEDSRSGEIYISDGTFLNIRSFSLPYGDYRGSFADNPFTLQAVQIAPERPEGVFMGEAERAFGEIAQEGKGEFIYAADPAELVEKIRELLEREAGKNVDIVICLDTTDSMKPYIDGVRRMLIPMMRETISAFTDFRIGMVLYKDHNDEYLNRTIPFTRDFASFQSQLNSIRVRGGGDTPEAVYEALYEGARKFSWEAESRLLILIGDAPPHPRQRGRVSGDMVYELVEQNGLTLNAILLSR